MRDSGRIDIALHEFDEGFNRSALMDSFLRFRISPAFMEGALSFHNHHTNSLKPSNTPSPVNKNVRVSQEDVIDALHRYVDPALLDRARSRLHFVRRFHQESAEEPTLCFPQVRQLSL